MATGSVSLRNVLTLALSALTKLLRGADVQEPSTLLYRLVASWRCVSDPMARSTELAAVSVAHSPA